MLLEESTEITYSVIFQEYHNFQGDDPRAHNIKWSVMQFMWVITCMFVTMAFSGTLKSSFVRQDFEKRTETLEEMLVKDYKIHAAVEYYDYFRRTSVDSDFSKRMVCQIEKTNGVYRIAS